MATPNDTMLQNQQLMLRYSMRRCARCPWWQFSVAIESMPMVNATHNHVM